MRAANYVEETTTSIAGASGNGAVTLTAISSVPRFSTVFGSGATTIRYFIEDTVGKRFETGIGEVSSNVLTRTRPQVTWDGSTYDDSTPSPLAFGSTPTSGNVKVRLSATAEVSNGFVMEGVNSSISSHTGFDYSANASWTGNGAAGALTANTEYYGSYLLPVAGQLQGIMLSVTTALASAGIKSALYPCNHAGLPGAKIVDFAILSATSTGDKSDVTPAGWTPAGPIWLTPGWYFVGYMSAHAISILGFSGVSQSHRTPVGRPGSGYGYSQGYSRSGGSYATGLPTNPAPTAVLDPGGDALGAPRIQLKVIA